MIQWNGSNGKTLEGELPELAIVPGAPSKIHTEDFPSNLPNGGALSFTAELRDVFDNTCTNTTDKLGVSWKYDCDCGSSLANGAKLSVLRSHHQFFSHQSSWTSREEEFRSIISLLSLQKIQTPRSKSRCTRFALSSQRQRCVTPFSLFLVCCSCDDVLMSYFCFSRYLSLHRIVLV